MELAAEEPEDLGEVLGDQISGSPTEVMAGLPVLGGEAAIPGSAVMVWPVIGRETADCREMPAPGREGKRARGRVAELPATGVPMSVRSTCLSCRQEVVGAAGIAGLVVMVREAEAEAEAIRAWAIPNLVPGREAGRAVMPGRVGRVAAAVVS